MDNLNQHFLLQKLFIHVLSPEMFFEDLFRCIGTTADPKINKRIKRADFILGIENINVSLLDIIKYKIVAGIKLFTCKGHGIQSCQMIHFLEKNIVEVQPNDMIFFDLPKKIISSPLCCKHENHEWMSICFKTIGNTPVPPPDVIKKSVESMLTSKLSSMPQMYNITCKFFKRIISKIFEVKNDNHLDVMKLISLVQNNQIVFELKGGMALRSLMGMLEVSTERREEIKEIFSFSDNDTSILIDPDLENFDEIHNKLCILIHDAMKELVNEFMEDLYEAINKIEHSTLDIGKRSYKLKHTLISGFRGFVNEDKHILIFDEKRPIKVQRNELLFYDHVECLHHFDLLRLKLPFNCANRTICGELLDITIPRKNECVLRPTFKHKRQMVPVDWISLNF